MHILRPFGQEMRDAGCPTSFCCLSPGSLSSRQPALPTACMPPGGSAHNQGACA